MFHIFQINHNKLHTCSLISFNCSCNFCTSECVVSLRPLFIVLLFGAPPSALIFIEDNAADTLAAYGSALDPDAADSTLFGLASLLSGKKCIYIKLKNLLNFVLHRIPHCK